MGNSVKQQNEKDTWFKTKVIIFFVFTLLLITFLGFTSYGIFISNEEQESTNRISTGCFSTTFTDGNSVSISNALPTPDSEGIQGTPYSFTLTNTCTIKVAYKVILNVKNSSFGDEYVQTSIDGTNAKTLSTYTVNLDNIDTGYTNSYVLSTGTLAQNANVTFNLRLWLKESTEYEQVSSSMWQGKIKVVNTPTT